MPSTKLEQINLPIVDILVKIRFAPSKGQAKILIQQGGISLNDQKVQDISYILSEDDFKKGFAVIRKGKKVYHKLEK